MPLREEIARLLRAGLSLSEIARRLDVAGPTVAYHANDAGHSVRECQDHFGFSRQSWHAAVKRGAIRARPHGLPLEELCAQGVHRGRANIRRRLIAAGLKDGRCERCGIGEWNGRALVMALHHVNGDRSDNRIENLELLCPNCHSQTSNYAGRRRFRRPAA